ncbi:MAG: hypothetical protein M1357_03305, partial [Candidatus Marsarchaeota archaeon]|nr:hypothetical protein [Candidatus Marsarchaeota archaeon]
LYLKNRSNPDPEEVARLVVVAQNNLAEVTENPSGTIRLVFPDNFQAREFRDKLTNYYPNWVMRKIRRRG